MLYWVLGCFSTGRLSLHDYQSVTHVTTKQTRWLWVNLYRKFSTKGDHINTAKRSQNSISPIILGASCIKNVCFIAILFTKAVIHAIPGCIDPPKGAVCNNLVINGCTLIDGESSLAMKSVYCASHPPHDIKSYCMVVDNDVTGDGRYGEHWFSFFFKDALLRIQAIKTEHPTLFENLFWMFYKTPLVFHKQKNHDLIPCNYVLNHISR